MGESIRLFSIRGIVLRVHITFPLILIWAILQFGVLGGGGWSGAVFGVVVMLLLFTIVVLHELGHSLAAQRYGVPVSEIVLLPIGGVARLKRLPEKPVQELVIAIAGPLVNVALAIVLVAVNRISGLGGDFGDPSRMLVGIGSSAVDAVFNYVFSANLFLAIFNLIPAFPMDGGRVLRALLATRMDYARATGIAVAVGQAAAWLMGLWGFLGGGFFLIVIAIFVYMGAGQEGQLIELRRVLGKLTVNQAYSRQARTLSPLSTLQEAIDLTLTTFQSDFPVCDGERLVGLLTYKRLIESLNQRGSATAVRDVMLTDIAPVRPDEGLFDVQQRMAEEQLDALPVVQDGRFLGLLTSRDVSEIYRLTSGYPGLLAQLAQPYPGEGL